MVGNGAVSYPSAWRHWGCNEIQSPPERFRLIDREQPLACSDSGSDTDLAVRHREWVEESLNSRAMFANRNGRRRLRSAVQGS